MKRRGYFLIATGAFLVLSGCCPKKVIQHNQESKYYSLSAPLTQLSSYGEEYARSGNPPVKLPESEFIANSAAHDAGMLTIFKDYELHIQRGNPFVAILVCEKGKDGSVAIMEDYSCTAKLDNQTWKDAPHSACKFAASIDTVCPPEEAQP